MVVSNTQHSHNNSQYYSNLPRFTVLPRPYRTETLSSSVYTFLLPSCLKSSLYHKVQLCPRDKEPSRPESTKEVGSQKNSKSQTATEVAAQRSLGDEHPFWEDQCSLFFSWIRAWKRRRRDRRRARTRSAGVRINSCPECNVRLFHVAREESRVWETAGNADFCF